MSGRVRVALLIETSNSYGRDLLRGVRDWSHDHGPWSFRLIERGRGAEPPGWLLRWPGEGIIARVDSTETAQLLRRTGRPVVDVGAALEEPVFPRVATDSRAVAALAFQHLRARGLEHFAYCGAHGHVWARRRGEHFAAEVQRQGLRCWVQSTRARSPEAEQVALAGWLRRLPRPCGVLAAYDVRGQQVLEACHDAGLRVPDDIAVLGVHDDALLCELCEPPLSSVAPDARGAGRRAAELLDRMLRGESIPVGVHSIPPIRVVTRQSTDLVAVDDRALAAVVRHIRAHATRGINVADVLRAVPMARTGLERRFRSAFGCTPRVYIEQVRIEAVVALLTSTDLSLAEIAERCGFEHPEYLSVVFRRVHGVPPGAFRARLRRAPTERTAGARTS